MSGRSSLVNSQFVLIFQEITGEWVSVYHVAVVLGKKFSDVIRYVDDCLLAGKCNGRYIGNRCVVYCTDDHHMCEVSCDGGLVRHFYG